MANDNIDLGPAPFSFYILIAGVIIALTTFMVWLRYPEAFNVFFTFAA